MVKYVLGLLVVLVCVDLSAQDPHFSQFNAAPLTLNPALTGKLPCTYRAAVNYRNQWNAVPAPYETFSAGFDAALWKNKIGGPNEAAGLGFLIMNDVQGDGNLTDFNINLSFAYHKEIAEGHVLSAGFQLGYHEKYVDLDGLIFNTQIDPNGVNGLPSGENLWDKPQYGNFHAGLHWSSIVSKNFSLNLGGALFNINRPSESFEGNAENQRDWRTVGHGGFSVAVSEAMSISPSFLFMRQGTAQELLYGSSFGYHMEEAALYLGAWYRHGDAIMALVGLEIASLIFGISYDVTVSEAAAANSGRGGVELTISYNGCVDPRSRIRHCPRF